MGESLHKVFLGVLALAASCIAIELIPVSRQATYWNRCLDSTVKWLDKAPKLNQWDDEGKELLAVAICNGAVHEPKLETKEDYK